LHHEEFLLEETKNVSKDEVLAKFKVGDIVKGKN
jgi:hypothetical protein